MKTMTEIFLQFLDTLHPKEKKAFLEAIKHYFSLYNNYCLTSTNEKPKRCFFYDSKTMVEQLIYRGLYDNSYHVCSSLCSFMRYLLVNKFPEIVGYDSNFCYYRHRRFDGGYGKYGRNELIDSMHYDSGKESYRSFHVKLYIKKWQDFLKENVVDYNKIFDFRKSFYMKFRIKDGQDSSI